MAAVATLLGGAFWRAVLRGPRWIDTPRPGRFHRRATSLAGGPAWLTGFLLGSLASCLAIALSSRKSSGSFASSLANTPSESSGWFAEALSRGAHEGLLLVLIASTSILAYLLGEIDDRGRIGPLPKAIAQAGLVIAPWLLFVQATRGTEGFTAGAVIGLLLALALQIALGIFDNMDGTLAAAALFGLLLLGASFAPSPALIAAGATAGFLVWNRPPARLFLGNRGSSALATATAGLFACHASGLSAAGAFVLLLPFAWPMVDLGFVTARRIRAGRRPWEGGRDHTTHETARLLRSDRLVWLLVGASAALGAALAHSLVS